MHAQSLQLCLTLCNPMDYSPAGSSVHGNLHGRMLQWVALPSCMDLPDTVIKHVPPVTPALQADSLPLSHQGSPRVTEKYKLIQGI